MSNAIQGRLTIAPAIRRWARIGWPQQRGRLPEYWRAVLDRDPELSSAVMVIELAFGGEAGGATVVRVATRPVTSTSSRTGTRYDAVPEIEAEPVIDHSYEVGVGSSAARSAAFTLDPALIDPAELVSQGVPLCGVAEVSLEPIDFDADHDERFVLIRGDIDGGVRFGKAGGDDPRNRELLEVEVVDPVGSTTTKLPPWVMGEERFGSSIHESANGARVPLVINRYDAVPAERITTTSPGTQLFVFAHGHGFSVDTSSGVRVNGVTRDSADVVYAWTATEATDDLGEPYSAINFTVAGTSWEDSDAVHVNAVHDTDELTVVGVARRVVEQHSALGIDGANASLFAEAEARFRVKTAPRILVNGAGGNSASSAREWLENGLAESFPMLTFVWEGGGYGPIVTDRRAEPRAEWTAKALPLIGRLRGNLAEETSKEDIFNEFVLRYDYDILNDVWRKVATRGASNSDLCAYSRRLFGERHADPLESTHIASAALAEFVLDWMVDHRALPSYLVTYEGMGSILMEYRRGDLILLTDPELGFDDEPTTIERIAYARGRCEVGLRVWKRFVDLGPRARSVP